MLHFKINEVKDFVLITISGDISINTITEFDRMMNRQLSKDIEIIAISMENLDSIDSTGINHLFKMNKKAYEENIQVIFLDIPKSHMQMLKVTNFHKISTIMTKSNFETEYAQPFSFS